jgi:RNA polymerase sigma-70 factor (ECF subfamily)
MDPVQVVVMSFGSWARLHSRQCFADEVAMTVSDELALAIERAKVGDARGFDTLFKTFGGTVAGYVRARGVSDPDGVANDVFLRAFRAIHTFHGDGDRFRAWLFTIAHHAAVDDGRRRRRRIQEAPIEYAPESVGGDVESEVMTRLAHERVELLLRGLSADQREVLVLRVVADLSVADTAAILGRSYEGVRALQRRALAALRRKLSDQEGVRQ